MHIETLFERVQPREQHLLPELAGLYNGDLAFPTSGAPYVIANFVQTIDGVVSFGLTGRPGGISGGSLEDRFVMGLLRCLADAVLVGAGTFRADRGHVRTAQFVYPAAAGLFTKLRAGLGKPPLPLNVIVTASGRIDLAEASFRTKGLSTAIITTQAGAERLARRAAPEGMAVRIGRPTLAPADVIALLAEEFGVRLLLHEGGPATLGPFLMAKLIDELFLTIAPQIAGRHPDAPRPSIAGEALFLPETAPWFSLQSLKRASDHLLLHYRSGARERKP